MLGFRTAHQHTTLWTLTGLKLAAIGFRRFLKYQDRRKAAAEPTPHALLVAAGHGYIDFARDNPALFKLMFTSDRTCVSNSHFASAARDAFMQLVADVGGVIGEDPERSEAGKVAVSAS